MKHTKIILAAALFLCKGCTEMSPAWGADVNMEIIARIESSNGTDAKAYELNRYAIGKYQVSRPVLFIYNRIHHTNFIASSLLYNSICLRVSQWYINHYIPRLLKKYGLNDTIPNRLIAYNLGICKIINGKIDNKYVAKYLALEKQK